MGDLQSPVRLAIIGAGIFARDAHIPAIKAAGNHYDVKVIYSRNLENAQRLTAMLPNSPDAVDDLNAIWKRDDIEAVDILLPVMVAPTVIESALKNGKHVLSEKPIAPTVAVGRNLATLPQPGQLWMVGENYRFDPTFQQIADLIAGGEIGAPLLVHYVLHMPVTPESKYFNSVWRKKPEFPGGWLLDSGVHHIAALRIILGEIAEVSAYTANMSHDLNSLDTLVANLKFTNGVMGHYSITYAGGPQRHIELIIHGENGYITLSQDGILIQRGGDAQTRKTERVFTIDAEVVAFADAIRSGGRNPNPPLEALQDLAVMEAIIKSAEQGQTTVVEQVIGAF